MFRYPAFGRNGFLPCAVKYLMTSTHSVCERAAMWSFKLVVKFFTALGRKPFYQRLDNETSATLENYLKAEHITIQYCPPGQDRSNIAERSIQTFKNHAIPTHSTADPLFPSFSGTDHSLRWNCVSVT